MIHVTIRSKFDFDNFADRKQKLVVLRTEEVGFHTEENFLQRMDSQETHDVAVRQSLASDP